MKRTIIVIILGGLLDWYGPAAAKSGDDLGGLWRQMTDTLRGGQTVAVADTQLTRFTASSRADRAPALPRATAR
jgi:hypothetical protein